MLRLQSLIFKYMSKECPITGKTSQVGGGYSNAIRATQFNPTGKRRRQVNLQKKTYFVPELGKNIKLRISTRAIKIINKNGLYTTLKKAGLVK